MPNTTKLSMVNITPSTWLVRNDCTREWSPMRCNKSPINFVSKNDIGSFKSFMKKSLTSDMLILIEMCSNSQRRMKSVAVRPVTIISSPSRIIHIKPMSLCLMPRSTMPCVRNGMMSCNTQPSRRPRNIWKKYLRYSITYPQRNLNDLFSPVLSSCLL